MKKVIKKILKWTGITFLLLIIALILIPIFFKDQIKQLVIDEVNKMLTAELTLEDFDLTFISTFPNMTIKLYGAGLTGKNEFEGVKLAEIKELRAHVGLWDVISGDQIEIDEVHIFDPSFDVRVLQDGKANYDIMKPDSLKTPEELEEPSSFKLSLNEYSINNAKIRYDDRSSELFADIDSMYHVGKGDLTADVIDFETETRMSKLTFEMGGISYLSEVKTDAMINLLMEFSENSSKFTLKENKINLNAISFAVDGFYEILTDKDRMDLKLDASDASFKDLLSLIPTFYQTGYEGMVSSGNLKLKGLVKGDMTETDLPGWDFGLKVTNASIKYPDLPGKISAIQIDASSKFAGGANLDKMTVDVPKFHANLGENSIDASLYLKQIMTDPNLRSHILAKINLATLKNYIPMAEGEEYNGKLKADVNIKGRMSDLERGDFEKFTAEGDVVINDMLYKSKDLPDEVSIKTMKLLFAPQYLALDELDAKMGKSDFRMKGKVDNYFGYMLRDEVLKGDFAFNSNYLDLDALMPAETEPSKPTKGDVVKPIVEKEDEVMLVPANIDFTLNTSLNDVKYNGISAKNVTGKVVLKDEIAHLDNLRMNTMGGTVGLRGAYNTQNHVKPKVDFGYTLEEVDIKQLVDNFLTVEKLAPIAKYANGKISSNFDMKTDITASFEPILSSLSSIGDIRSKTLAIKDVKILQKIENATKLNNLSDQTLKDFKTKFSVNDGKLTLSPFDLKLGKINSVVSGYTTLDQQINYNFKMNVPKDQIPAAMVKEVEAAMSKLNALVPKLEIGKLPDFIPVNVLATGETKNPKITTDFKEAILKATGDFKDNLINSVTETVKDTVSAIINNQIDNAKEEIEKQKQKILDEAQREADKIKAEGKKAADLIRSEADKQANQLIKEAGSNIVKKKLAEEAAKKLRSEADAKAKKVEAEAAKKADDVMRAARERADKLG